MHPSEDALRWNIRYLQGWYSGDPQPPHLLLEHAGLLPTSGLALDAAMGLGGAASFLLEHGLRVIGVDISVVASTQAKRRFPALSAVVADLSVFYLPPATFDVICNFYYLNRSLWGEYRRALRKGGLLIIETLTRAMLEQKPDIDPGYLLEPGELRQAFEDWQILFYDEGWTQAEHGTPHAVASLVARFN